MPNIKTNILAFITHATFNIVYIDALGHQHQQYLEKKLLSYVKGLIEQHAIENSHISKTHQHFF